MFHSSTNQKADHYLTDFVQATASSFFSLSPLRRSLEFCVIEESTSRLVSLLPDKQTFNLKLEDNALDSIYGCELKFSNGPMFMSVMCR